MEYVTQTTKVTDGSSSLREFFDDSQKNPELESLKSELVQLQQRLCVVEAVLSSGRGSRERNSMLVMSELIKPKALTTAELAERLQVTPQEIDEALSQGIEKVEKCSRSWDPALIHTIL